jgi:uncharacterized membrane protein
MTDPAHHDDRQTYWLDDPGNVRKVSIGLIVLCVALMLLDLVMHKHPHFPIENWFGFYGFFGFISFVSIVLAGKVMRRVVGRKEDYYDG